MIAAPGVTLYTALIKDIRAALSTGIANAQKVVEYQRVKTCWAVGQHITRTVDASDGALSFNRDLYERISRDIHAATGLDLSQDTIQRAVRFYHVYPEFPMDTPLTFTHYIALTRVADDKDRARLEREAIKAEMTTPQLKDAIRRIKVPELSLLPSAPGTLTVARGEPYIYHARSFMDLNDRPRSCVDLGFKIHIPLDSSLIKAAPRIPFPKGKYVRSYKRGKGYELRGAPRQWKKTHTYAARVYNVVDGDTVDALVDAGFGARVRDRFRLKGIDAPETSTRVGQEARAFVTAYFAENPFMVVRTFKAEMYGRWLGDVFTLPGSEDPFKIAEEGEFFNQVMLEKGLAGAYR
jgi:micrococcal nuclease